MANDSAETQLSPTVQQLDEWQDLADHAAAWELDGFADGVDEDSVVHLSIYDGRPSNPSRVVASDIHRHRDAEAIEMVTTAVPALIAEVKRLRLQLEELSA